MIDSAQRCFALQSPFHRNTVYPLHPCWLVAIPFGQWQYILDREKVNSLAYNTLAKQDLHKGLICKQLIKLTVFYYFFKFFNITTL